MKALKPRDMELVALGASVASNCIPCVKYHIREARGAGLSVEAIQEAIDLAESVRRVPAKKVMEAASAALRSASNGASEAASDCACGEDVPESQAESDEGGACCDPRTMQRMMREFAGWFPGRRSGNPTRGHDESEEQKGGCGS